MSSPRDHLQPVEYLYPMPGTNRLYAVIRHVEVGDGDRRVMVWRAVTYAQPRELIGYWPDLDECVMKVHKQAVRENSVVPSIVDHRSDSHGMPPIGWERNRVRGSGA